MKELMKENNEEETRNQWIGEERKLKQKERKCKDRNRKYFFTFRTVMKTVDATRDKIHELNKIKLFYILFIGA
jgi:hypothetical protein